MKDIIDIEKPSLSSRYLEEPCGIFESRCYALANHMTISKGKRKKTIYDLHEKESNNDVKMQEIMM